MRKSLDYANDADLLILTRRRLSTVQVPRPPQSPGASRLGTLLVVCDDSNASWRAVEMAVRLCRDDPAGLTVLVSTPAPEGASQLLASVSRFLRERGIDAAMHGGPIHTAKDLIAATREHTRRMLLLTWNSPFVEERALETLLDQVGCPIGLLQTESRVDRNPA